MAYTVFQAYSAIFLLYRHCFNGIIAAPRRIRIIQECEALIYLGPPFYFSTRSTQLQIHQHAQIIFVAVQNPINRSRPFHHEFIHSRTNLRYICDRNEIHIELGSTIVHPHLFIYLFKSGIFKLVYQLINIFCRLRTEKIIVGYVEFLIVEFALLGKKRIDCLPTITRALLLT